MTDQAQNLRDIVSKNIPETTKIVKPAAKPTEKKKPKLTARVITITSGKGGAGKTNFSVNLAVWLASQGKRVVIIDADFGLANIEVLFGVWPKFSIADIISGKKTVAEILTKAHPNVQFISGGTGFRDLANVTEGQMEKVLKSFEYLDEVSDIILVDTGAGISKTVTTFVKASSEAIVVTTPEPTAISDSYTLIKAVCEEREKGSKLSIVVNKADSGKEGQYAYEKLKSVCEKFLKFCPNLLGVLPNDDDLVKSVKEQKPVLLNRPGSKYAKAIEVLGKNLLSIGEEAAVSTERTGILAFMKKIVSRK